MKFIQVFLIMSFPFFVGSGLVFAKDTPKAECSQTSSGVFLKIKTSQISQWLPLPDKDSCDFSVEVIDKVTVDGIGGIAVGSSESGLNAYETIFISKIGDSKFIKIGDLPVAAEETTQGVFRFKNQQGGSVFIIDYIVSSKGINTSKDEYELVSDGSYCSANSKLTPTDESIKCSKPIQATFKKPLCFIHNNNKIKQVGSKRCLSK